MEEEIPLYKEFRHYADAKRLDNSKDAEQIRPQRLISYGG